MAMIVVSTPSDSPSSAAASAAGFFRSGSPSGAFSGTDETGVSGTVWLARPVAAGLDLVAHGINVNAIAPGVVDGEHWDHVDSLFARYENLVPGEKKRQVGAAVPYGRMGTPEDLTGMAVFLASSAADYIVAQTYNVDGGNWMS